MKEEEVSEHFADGPLFERKDVNLRHKTNVPACILTLLGQFYDVGIKFLWKTDCMGSQDFAIT